MSVLPDNPFLAPLETVPPGRVCLRICPEIPDQLAAIESSQLKGENFSAGQFVTHVFHPLPPLEAVIDNTLAALAEVALALWPAWYGQPAGFKAEETAVPSLSDLLRRRPDPAAPQRRISRTWFKTAAQRCREGQPPLCLPFPLALQVQQLALALAPENLLIILAVEEPSPAPQRLFGLAKAAAWYAKETAGRVMVLVPPSAALPEELESLFYGGITVAPLSPDPPLPVSAPETKLRYGPVEGTPHPFSPGEQRLARELATDPTLAGLFAFNQRVQTVHGNHYLVDLLWRAEKLAVEVDGFRVHSRRHTFYQDRHRDYELLISGYTTLRLSHDEVLADMPRVLEKIRAVVRFCHNNPKISQVPNEEAP